MCQSVLKSVTEDSDPPLIGPLISYVVGHVHISAIQLNVASMPVSARTASFHPNHQFPPKPEYVGRTRGGARNEEVDISFIAPGLSSRTKRTTDRELQVLHMIGAMLMTYQGQPAGRA